MDLVDRLLQTKANKIVILDTPMRESERSRLEDDLSALAGRSISLEFWEQEAIRQTQPDDAYVLIPARPDLLSLVEAEKTARTLPSGAASVVIAGANGNAHVFRHVLSSLFAGANPSADILGMPGDESVATYLRRQADMLWHGRKNKDDARFKQQLSAAFSQGNKQSSSAFTFLITSRSLPAAQGRFEMVSGDTDFASLDFGRYALILVDNAWDPSLHRHGMLGTGVKVLEQIKDLAKDIPIVYQSGHPLDRFSEEERKRITGLGALLVPKNLAFKTCDDEAQARKELAIGEYLARDPVLRGLAACPVPLGEKGYLERGNGTAFMVATESAKCSATAMLEQRTLLRRLGLAEIPTTQKLYTLALWHARLKDAISDARLQTPSIDFYPLERIAEGIQRNAKNGGHERLGEALSAFAAKYADAYRAIVREHRRLEATVLSHGDAKWDNWFAGIDEPVLGDFGSAHPGREYKDIAKSLMDPDKGFETTLDTRRVDAAIHAYLQVRAALDKGFSEDAQLFRKRVYQMMVTESLRTAFYKARDTSMALGLIAVAGHYASLLTEQTDPSHS